MTCCVREVVFCNYLELIGNRDGNLRARAAVIAQTSQMLPEWRVGAE